MPNIRFELDIPGLDELMKSGEMQSVLNSVAASIQGSAGPGYEIEYAHPLTYTAIAAVHANSRETVKDCFENNALLKYAGSVKVS